MADGLHARVETDQEDVTSLRAMEEVTTALALARAELARARQENADLRERIRQQDGERHVFYVAQCVYGHDDAARLADQIAASQAVLCEITTPAEREASVRIGDLLITLTSYFEQGNVVVLNARPLGGSGQATTEHMEAACRFLEIRFPGSKVRLTAGGAQISFLYFPGTEKFPYRGYETPDGELLPVRETLQWLLDHAVSP